MAAPKGNKFAKGGKRVGAGRKSSETKEIERKAAEVALEYIERSVRPVMSTYFQLAHGRLVNKWHEGKIVGQEFEADAATTRHCVDKLVPAVKQIEITGKAGGPIITKSLDGFDYTSYEQLLAGLSTTAVALNSPPANGNGNGKVHDSD